MIKTWANIFFILSMVVTAGVQAQSTKIQSLQELSLQFEQTYQQQHQRALQVAQEKGWDIRKTYPDGRIMELQRLEDDGMPVYYVTYNLDAAKTVSTDRLWPSGLGGYNLTGAGMTVAEWDGGGVLADHQEFGGRVTQQDSPGDTSDHATHVAGTILASGIYPAARGMAYQATLDAYKWDNDNSEMTSAASNGLLVSNHSYGRLTGWSYDWDEEIWYWYGNVNVSTTEDYAFGFYTGGAQAWDQIANNAPHYLIVKSAGNDRNESGPSPNTPYKYWEPDSGDWVLESTTTRNPDGVWDCIPSKGTAKNILTLGAATDIPSGYSNPSDVSTTGFSSYGPTDDGRIKPDIVANGDGLYSSIGTNQSAYDTYSGTSMSSPNTTGSLLLLRELYQSMYPDTMLASTLKALVIHTADEADNIPGPDYANGWGMLNTASAAQVIANQGMDRSNLIQEQTLADGGTYSLDFQSAGNQPLRATITWNDPAGTPPSIAVDPATSMLVNDLDMYIEGPDGMTFPYVLDPANPANAPTTGDNTRDNVEQVFIEFPSQGNYTLHVDHKGSLSGGSQDFSLVVSGASAFGSNNPMSTNVVAGSGFDGIVPLTWDAPDGSENANQVSQRLNAEDNFLQDFQVQESSSGNTGIDGETKAVSSLPQVDYYKIYRKSKPATAYQLIGQIDPDDRHYMNDQDYIDEAVENDSTYFYAVSAVYETGGEGAMTDPVTGTPEAAGFFIESGYTASEGTDWWDANDGDLTTVNPSDGYVDLDVMNNANTLYLRILDDENTNFTDYNEVGVYLDTDNNGTWDSSLPSNEGNYWVSYQDGQVNTSFRSIYGTYPQDLQGENIDIEPAGFDATVTEFSSWLEYELSIDFTASGLNVQPGDTLGFRIYNLDMDRYTDTYYGFDSWPYGNIWIAPRTYGKLVLATEPAANASPTLTSVGDAPNDQGKHLQINWSETDQGESQLVDYYKVWVRYENGESTYANMGTDHQSDVALRTADEPANPTTGNWFVADTVTGSESETYSAIVETPADSSAAGIPWVSVKVSAHVGEESSFSEVYETYSVDNLAPDTPQQFSGERQTNGIHLMWKPGNANDVDRYLIRRSVTARITESSENSQIYSTPDTSFIVSEPNADEYYYSIAAKDINGNVGEYTDPISVQSTGAQDRLDGIPEKFTLRQNFPNPFNPATTISYGIPEVTHVSLEIYDLRGNRVTTLVNRVQSAGWHTIRWHGKDSAGNTVGTGAYLLRINTGNHTATQKMIYMK